MSEPSQPEADLPEVKGFPDPLPFHRTPLDKQLVRTTFKLTPEALEARALLASRFDGSTHKALDAAAHMASLFLDKELAHRTFKPPEDESKMEYVRRTMILTKGALREIEAAAERAGSHRDHVLEKCLHYLDNRSAKKAKELAQLHQQVTPVIDRVRGVAEQAKDELQDVLGWDDPVYKRMNSIWIFLDTLLGDMAEEFENGTPVDPDEF